MRKDRYDGADLSFRDMGREISKTKEDKTRCVEMRRETWREGESVLLRFLVRFLKNKA